MKIEYRGINKEEDRNYCEAYITYDEKKEQKKADKIFDILTEKGYIRYFSECCQAYREQYNEENGILPVCAVTAVELTEDQTAKLKAKLEKITGKTVELVNRTDPTCLGGVRLDYDGRQVDGTIKNRLDSIHGLLKNTVL